MWAFRHTVIAISEELRIVGNTVPRNNFYTCFIISYFSYMFLPLFGRPQAEYTILVIGSYYTHNGSVFLYSISLRFVFMAKKHVYKINNVKILP
jgi:hypothetical protein